MGNPRKRQNISPNQGAERAEWIVAAVLTAILVAFHIARAFHAGPLWRDEAAEFNLARMPSLRQLWDGLRLDSFGPGAPLLFRFWTATDWGASDAGVRTLGCVIGISVLAALWLAGRLLLRGRPPLVSLVLLGFNGTVLVWGDSLRGYGLGMLWMLLTLALLWKVVESPKPWTVAGAALLAVLSVQTMYQNAFLLLAGAVGAMAVAARRGQWQRAGLVLGTGAVAAVSLLPYTGIFQAMSAANDLMKGPITVSLLARKSAEAFGSPGEWMAWVWMVLGAAGLIVAVGHNLRKPMSAEADRLLFAAVTAVVGVVGFYGIWLWRASYETHPWNYLPLLAPMALMLEVMLDGAVRNTALRWWRLAGVVALAAVLVLPLWGKIRVRQTNMDLVARELSRATAPGDLIFINPWQLQLSFQRYYDGPVRCITFLSDEPLRLHRMDLLAQAIEHGDPVSRVTQAMADTLKNGKLVWVVIGPRKKTDRARGGPAVPFARASAEDVHTAAWWKQTRSFMEAHVRESQDPPRLYRGVVNDYENIHFVLFRGWKD